MFSAIRIGNFTAFEYAAHSLHNLVTFDCINECEDETYLNWLSDITDEAIDNSQPNPMQSNKEKRSNTSDDDTMNQSTTEQRSFIEQDAQQISIKELIKKCKKIYNKLKWNKQLLRESYEIVSSRKLLQTKCKSALLKTVFQTKPRKKSAAERRPHHSNGTRLKL